MLEKLTHRILVVTGHFGSGKTEFSINLGETYRKQGYPVELIDLDIINTYFRLREQEDMLNKDGIKVLYTGVVATTLDIPALDPAIDGALYAGEGKVIVDVGGNPSGARALSRYAPTLDKAGYDHVFVINSNRPETKTAKEAIDFLRNIEATAQVHVTHLLNTTNLLKATTAEDVLEGQALIEEVSKQTRLPILGTAAMEPAASKIKELEPDMDVFPMHLYFRDKWML